MCVRCKHRRTKEVSPISPIHSNPWCTYWKLLATWVSENDSPLTLSRLMEVPEYDLHFCQVSAVGGVGETAQPLE